MPKYEIKTVVTGADQAAQEINKTSQALGQTTAATQKVEAETSKLVTTKEKWLGAIKKLSHEIPGLGYVLGALKNPLVALIAVIAVFLDSLEKIREAIKRIQDAVGSGTITTNFQQIGKILAESRTTAKELADEIDRIRNRPATPQERGAKAMADFDRMQAVEAAADDRAKAQALAGVQDPQARAAIEARFDARSKQRAQARLGKQAEVATQKDIDARNAMLAAQQAAPGEMAALDQAKQKHQRAMELAAAQETTPEAMAEMQRQLHLFDTTLSTPKLMRSYEGLQITAAYHGDEGIRQARELLAANIENAQRGNVSVGALRANADAALAAAQGRFDRFRAGFTGAAENTRTFGQERAAAAATADALRPFNDPGAQARADATRALQVRFDAQLQALIQALTNTISKTTSQVRATQQDQR